MGDQRDQEQDTARHHTTRGLQAPHAESCLCSFHPSHDYEMAARRIDHASVVAHLVTHLSRLLRSAHHYSIERRWFGCDAGAVRDPSHRDVLAPSHQEGVALVVYSR